MLMSSRFAAVAGTIAALLVAAAPAQAAAAPVSRSLPELLGRSRPGGPMFSEVVRRHRRRMAMTQEELAESASLTSRTVRDIETGRTATPRPGTVRRLAAAFDLRGAERQSFCAAAYGLDGHTAGALESNRPVSPPAGHRNIGRQPTESESHADVDLSERTDRHGGTPFDRVSG
jgi:transcriptional regulator with XRE-family HTH domain